MNTTMMNGRRGMRAAGGLILAVGLGLACTDTTGTALTYTVGGTVSGLAGSGLVLRDNDGDDLSVTANGPVVFATPLASDAAYHVTVFAQPSSPTQSCVVTGGTGTMSHANITNIAVTCTVVPSVLGTHVIAFVSAAPGASQWYRMDGSGRTLIRDVAATETDPIASPDGQRIAFASRGGGSRGGIFVMGSDGSAVIQLTEMSNDSTSVPIGWSRDGTRVFYLTSALNAVQAADLSVVNAGGGAPIGLVTIPHSLGHALSPDGSMIAFSSYTGGPGTYTIELHVMRTDGTHEQAVATAGPEIPGFIDPAWSPDGQWIAFSSDGCDIGNLSNLYRVRADGSDLTMLARFDPGTMSDPSSGCVAAPAWSPDGARLAVSTEDPSGPPPAGSFTSTLVDASGGQVGPRNPTASWVARSAWSQDGSVLAILPFASVGEPGVSLYLSSPAGARPVLLAGQVSGMVFLR